MLADRRPRRTGALAAIAVLAAVAAGLAFWMLHGDPGARGEAASSAASAAGAAPATADLVVAHDAVSDDGAGTRRLPAAEDGGPAAPDSASGSAGTAEEPRATVAVTLLLERSRAPHPGCDVHVMVTQPGTNRLMSIEHARTDAAGRCELEVPAARAFALEAGSSAPRDESDVGWIRRAVDPLASGERREIELELPNGLDTDFWGRVVAEDGGEGLAGARIVRREDRDNDYAVAANGAPASATSAADGLFHLRFASWRRGPTFSIELAGFGPALFRPEAGHVDAAAPLVLPLRRPATLGLRVLGLDAEAPAARVLVETDSYQIALPNGAFLFETKPRWSARLDDGMHAELVLPARVPLRLVLEGIDLTPLPFDEMLTFEPGERREIEWRVGGGAVLIGRLVDQDDEPVARVELWLAKSALAGDAREGTALFYSGDVRLVHASTRTAEDGGFRFDDVPPGMWWVGPKADRLPPRLEPRTIAPLATGVEILPGEAQRDVLLRTWRGLVIEGRVLDPWGKPAPGESVRARSDTVGGFVEARTDDDGAFTLGPLAQAEYQVSTGVFSKYAAADPVPAPAGATNVVLKLREGAAVRGLVVDGATGAPVAADLWISFRGVGVRSSARAGDDGAFARAGLAPGVYDIAAWTADGRAGVLAGVELRAGEERDGIRLEVRPGARLTVLYTGGATYAYYTIFHGNVPAASDGLHTGTSATRIVPAGALRVEMRTSDGRVETREITLAAGASEELAFDFE